MGEVLSVTPTCRIPLAELTWTATTSGGPGGQHANRAQTRVEVRFDVATSASLGPRQRARLLERVGPVARAAADDQRSQARNREVALERLRSKLAEALRERRPRVTTRPGAGAEQRRLDAKRRRADVKRLRSRPGPDTDDP